MNAERFAQIVAAYGADPARWPEAERAAAEAFAQRPEAASNLGEARALDAALDAGGDMPVSLDLVRAVRAGAPKIQSASLWAPMAALAACALIGVVIGVGGARMSAENRAAEAALTFLLEAGDIS